MIRVKICGITRPEDAQLAVELGASAIGMILWPGSPRFVDVQRAREIVAAVSPDVETVGVFVNQTGDAFEVAGEIGLSERQLRRRCQDAVGYGPKTLQRVLRFRRFVSRIDADPHAPGSLPAGRDERDLATLAAQAGYADQAHLSRECHRLAGLTPAALARERAL